ncbi:MAG: type II toxin-antitoxin system HicA family toxin [Caldilinea sp.]|jgi:predicted RNA binding protein YcfA (HicA-like mRNA interferase family)
MLLSIILPLTKHQVTCALDQETMPKKIRELIRDLEQAGFVNRGGKGSHRNFVHPRVTKPVVISGQPGADAQRYQERAVNIAIEESKK